MHLFKLFLLLTLSLLLGSIASANDQRKVEKQRQTYQLAEKALKTNQLNLFRTFQNKLTGYPLEGYLQYRYLRHRLQHVSPDVIEAFLQQEKDTFYTQRLRIVWLKRLAKDQNWPQFIRFYQVNQSAELDCFYSRALINTGQQQEAFQLLPDMWLVPHSQHKSCDPAFKLWQQQGYLTKDLYWQRMLLALRQSQFSLANYLAKSTKSPKQAQDWVKRWQSIHTQPQHLLGQLPIKPPANPYQVSLARDTALSREIILHGIQRLARRDAKQAFNTWLRLKDIYQFSPQQKREIRQYIGKRAALSRQPEALKYFGGTPAGEWHVRAALWQQNWPVVKQVIENLPSQQQSSLQWQYWLARAKTELGQHTQAEEIYTRLLNERDYYSFLAADQLDQQYQMNHRPIIVKQAELDAFKQDPSIKRLYEFYQQDLMLEARREAYYQRKTRTKRELQLMATLTHQWGWHNMAIAILGSAKYWDALDLRFPVLFDKEMRQASSKTGLDSSWLFAIARQESAFNPKARSHAGARGLMQLMPATGKLISKLINKPIKSVSELYNSQRNIELGSAYLHKMYIENQRNPVLATASYNAGPHRVAKWLPPHTLPADIWTENIPFNETRHYVKNVMSYAAIFDSQRNQPITPLADRMPAVNSKNP